MPRSCGMPRTPDPIALLVADVFEAAGTLRRIGDEIASTVGQTQARWQLLSVVSDGECTVSAVARRLGITRQSVQRVADLLASDGLTTYGQNPNDARAPLVHITPEGRDALAAITRRARAWHRRAGRDVSTAEVERARRVLQHVVAAARDEAVRQASSRGKFR